MVARKYKIVVKYKNCIGCGVCGSLMPEYFDLDYDESVVIVKKFEKQGDTYIGEITEKQLSDFEEVKQSCPEEVFEITEIK